MRFIQVIPEPLPLQSELKFSILVYDMRDQT